MSTNIVTQEELASQFDAVLDWMREVRARKNADYSAGDDALRNFKYIETLTRDRISAMDGILVRISDKVTRLANLLDPNLEARVSDEKFEETCFDGAVYMVLLGLVHRAQRLPKPVELPMPDIFDVPQASSLNPEMKLGVPVPSTNSILRAMADMIAGKRAS